MAGFWTHYNDTLLITSDKRYYTNAEAISYMCGPSGEIACDDNKKDGFLKGFCSGNGAEMQLRTNSIDTLFVITTGSVWTPYTRASTDEPKPDAVFNRGFKF